jgi:hypothetical protein
MGRLFIWNLIGLDNVFQDFGSVGFSGLSISAFLLLDLCGLISIGFVGFFQDLFLRAS